MKAKILQGVEISPTEMLMIGAEVEVLKEYYGCSCHYYVCELPNGRQINIDSEKLEITDWRPYIDWEQRRYELTKLYSVEIIRLQMEAGIIDCGYSEKKVTEYAISMANELIAHLKKE